MKKAVAKSRPLPLQIETLENRRLLAGEPWGAYPKLIGQDQAVANYPSITGEGTAVAVIDTGVDYMHPALGGGFGPGYKVVGGYDFVDNDANPMDSDGHGTGIAGLIAGNEYTYNGAKYRGIAPDADIIALRTDPGTWGYNKAAPYIEKALQWVIAHRDQYNIVAVNMAFGRGHFTEPTTIAPIDDELATLNAMGVLLVAASGNDGAGTGAYGVEYPAADPNVYGAGSIDASGAISTFTERGPGLDILAPGNQMPMPFYLPATNSRIILGNGYGTSFSIPYIVGTAALLRQIDPTLTPADMISIMQRSGVANYDGDDETGNTTKMTFQRLQLNNALTMALVESDDAYENNDTFATATPINFSGATTVLNDLMLVKGDADFYRFTIGAQGDVHFAFTSPSALSVDLVNSSGTKLATLGAAGTQRLAAGTYFIRVNAPAATLAGVYSIALTPTLDDTHDNHTPATALNIPLTDGSGVVSAMRLLAGADDFFKFTLNATSDVDLAISGGNPPAQLLDANGNVIADFSGSVSRRLDAGTYLIRVYTATTLGAPYGVAVTATPYVAPPPVGNAPVPGANGTTSGIAYDKWGTLHFAWYDEATQNLKYAARSAQGNWSAPIVVDPGQAAGQYISIAVDSAGLPGIAYFDAYNADLKFARYSGSAWNLATVDATKITGYYPSLQFNGSDRAVISYFYRTGGDLRLATQGASGWTIDGIDSVGDVGRSSSVAYNPLSGRWSVAYEDTGNGTFKYADQTKSGWAPVTFDATTKGGGGYISLAFTASKRPAISYYDAYNADLKFAAFDGSKWSNQVVAGKGTVGLYSNLYIDPTTGATDILYFNKGSDQAWRARATGAGWTLSQVTNPGGRWISRAFYQGTETIAYVKDSGLAVLDV